METKDVKGKNASINGGTFDANYALLGVAVTCAEESTWTITFNMSEGQDHEMTGDCMLSTANMGLIPMANGLPEDIQVKVSGQPDFSYGVFVTNP